MRNGCAEKWIVRAPQHEHICTCGNERGDVAGNEGNFEDGAHVQELINAVERSFRQRRWVNIPLAGDRTA